MGLEVPRDDGHRTWRAVEQSFGRAAREHPTDPAHVAGADHDDAGARVPGGRLERPGGRLVGEREQLDVRDVDQCKGGARE